MAVDFFFEQKEKISMITMQIGRKLKSRMLPVSTLASVECLTMPSVSLSLYLHQWCGEKWPFSHLVFSIFSSLNVLFSLQ